MRETSNIVNLLKLRDDKFAMLFKSRVLFQFQVRTGERVKDGVVGDWIHSFVYTPHINTLYFSRGVGATAVAFFSNGIGATAVAFLKRLEPIVFAHRLNSLFVGCYWDFSRDIKLKIHFSVIIDWHDITTLVCNCECHSAKVA